VKRLIAMVVAAGSPGRSDGRHLRPAPSDYPEFAEYLAGLGIDSMSLNLTRLLGVATRLAAVRPVPPPGDTGAARQVSAVASVDPETLGVVGRDRQALRVRTVPQCEACPAEAGGGSGSLLRRSVLRRLVRRSLMSRGNRRAYPGAPATLPRCAKATG
jgi:hypothetical protein